MCPEECEIVKEKVIKTQRSWLSRLGEAEGSSPENCFSLQMPSRCGIPYPEDLALQDILGASPALSDSLEEKAQEESSEQEKRTGKG